MKIRLFIFSILLLGFSTDIHAQDSAAVASKINTYALKVQKDWNIPGYGLAVIKDGRPLLVRGYGVKERGKSGNVDENTVFQIGSVSKSFTSALMAMMVESGKVKWNDKVKDILPDFEMADKYVEENLLVKDIMTHKLGFAGQAGTYIPNVGYSRDDVYRMMCRLEPRYGFRDGMHYNNMTFLIALRIIEKVSGMSWDENVRTRIFEPLGMTSSSCGGEGYLAASNVAVQHSMYRSRDTIAVKPVVGENRALHWLTVVGPAGGVNCSVADLSRWAEFHRTGGINAEGRRLISESQMNYLHKGVQITSQTDEKITLYGQCWYIEQNHKYRVYYHTGTTWGHSALCVFMPEQNLSIAMLFGSEVPNGPRFALMRRIIDICLGEPETDYSAIELKSWMKGSGGGGGNGTGFTIPYSKGTPSNLSITGKYTKDDLFGDATVSLENGKLYITVGKMGWKHRLIHDKGNRYKFTSDGHTFPVIFKPDGSAFEINWGGGEKFGPWTK